MIEERTVGELVGAMRTAEQIYQRYKDRLAKMALTTVPEEWLCGTDADKLFPHECYARAWQYVTQLEFMADSDNGQLWLVHGENILGLGGHGWVEISDGDLVFDGVLQLFFRREDYYAATSAVKWYRYTPKAAVICSAHISDTCRWDRPLRLPMILGGTQPMDIFSDDAVALLKARKLGGFAA